MQPNEQDKNEESKKGFKDLLAEHIIPNVEKISGVVVLVGLVFRVLQFEGAIQMLGIGLSTLSVTYYLNAFVLVPKDDDLIKQVVVKAGFVAGSVTLIGIMFTLLKLPGGGSMLSIGMVSLCAIIAIAVYKMLNSEEPVYKTVVIKLGIVFALGLGLVLG